jgi:inosine-uridine nucleoside N-ribohydrolase
VKLPFVIDADIASDDAVTLIMALQSPRIQVLAITTVLGNVDVDLVAKHWPKVAGN